MEPLMPRSSALAELASELVREASALTGLLHPITRKSVAELLLFAESYYSNLIEGRVCNPFYVERAMRGDYHDDPTIRALQLESRALIEVQQLIDERLESEPGTKITSPEFVCWIHALIYERLPEDFRWVTNRDRTRKIEVIPGRFRDGMVSIRRHVAPSHDALDRFMARFAEAYDISRLRDVQKIIAAAASHHRLLWIHPFYDGNGRVARLLTHAFVRQAKIDGAGLWSVSRGLAREHRTYVEVLAEADSPRWDDYDGRGNLSERALVKFCDFFLRSCLEQVRYMRGLLQHDALGERVMEYVELRAQGLAGQPKLRPEAGPLLREVVIRGEVGRGEASQIAGLSECSTQTIVGQLLEEGLLTSESPTGRVRIGFPAHAVDYLLPSLYPEEATGF